jgi:hypothetical protein
MIRALILLGLISACSKPATGSERGSCYGNGTCNPGLMCISDVCVKEQPGMDLSMSMTVADMAMSVDGALPDFSPVADLTVRDAARYDDAGLACPGASIFHPGMEPRMVGTSVPFVGRGRDANCMAITGSNLVWTDNLEGQIGTGETFNYTFTMVATHTVTLAAKDGANTYTASVTFMITN